MITADCTFCSLIREGRVRESYSDEIVQFVPLNPVTPGHLLFVPRQHMDPKIFTPRYSQLLGLAFEIASLFARTVGADHNLIINQGPAASQTVEHLHVHYVPRWPNDGLKLPWS